MGSVMAENSPEGRYIRIMFDDANVKYAKVFSQHGDVKIILNAENSFADDVTALEEEINKIFADMVSPLKLSVKVELDSELRIDKYIVEMCGVGKCNFGDFLDRVVSSLKVGELLVYLLPKK
ncbi:MAG: hypothetical protein U0944_00085 [Candidatus Moranbacteria bacterium]|nr:hypothetical protein [Candidatus Moranbacteria bacterium]MDZ4384802.1 hypothetical protein [Candidatus Moranbacteria bacterium]